MILALLSACTNSEPVEIAEELPTEKPPIVTTINPTSTPVHMQIPIDTPTPKPTNTTEPTSTPTVEPTSFW